MLLPPGGTPLTAPTAHRQSDVMPSDPLLHGRAYIDLARTAGACCPGA
ncbi:putative leader peptide [Streptomyces sp. NPDC057521]